MTALYGIVAWCLIAPLVLAVLYFTTKPVIERLARMRRTQPTASCLMIIAALILIALFLFTWWLSVRLDNYSFVDVTWSLSFAPVAVWYAASGAGWLPRRVAIAVLVGAWSLRLGIYLWRRVASHHPREDVRYAVLREKWQANSKRAFLGFFLVQAALVWLLMLPVRLISQQSAPGFHLLEMLGLAPVVRGFDRRRRGGCAARADFRREDHGGGICQRGLWYYSRHPNYFFQSLLWWGLFLMALPAPWGWTAIVAPLAMLHFLLNVTGIPMTEKLSVQRRGEAYLEYQRTTSAFVPWFKMRSFGGRAAPAAARFHRRLRLRRHRGGADGARASGRRRARGAAFRRSLSGRGRTLLRQAEHHPRHGGGDRRRHHPVRRRARRAVPAAGGRPSAARGAA